MRTTTPQKLAQLQRKPQNIRNLCILAHVDHGKTTLADALVASNGIISQRMAGKLRYLDSREDEQLRGITMKSSAISLHYLTNENEYLINLIDSPGHIDFSSEVSTAVRVCDGAIVVVDVVEGVCPQTYAVLRQAWLENLKPVLVLNKIDRLITELKMTPLEAHLHLQQTLEQVNAVMGELFASDVITKTSQNYGDTGPKTPEIHHEEKVYDWSAGLEETDDSNLYFSPDQDNVIFGSAIDGWGFGIQHFAALYAAKLGVNASVLRKTLWGDFYLEGKTKKIRKGAQAKAKKPLFVQFVLENIWSVYEAVINRRDKEMTEKIVKSLNLKIAPRDARQSDPRVHLQAILSQWLPLSKAVLGMVVDKLPCPMDMSMERVEHLMCSSMRRFDSLPVQTQNLKNDFLLCSSGENSPVIVFISKMVAMDRKALPQNRPRPLTQEELQARREKARQRHAEKEAAKEGATSTAKEGESEKQPDTVPIGDNISTGEETQSDQVFVAFARVYSGTVKKGTKLYVLGPKHDPTKVLQELESGASIDTGATVRDLASSKHVTVCEVGDLYLFMGRELEVLEDVPAGNVLGIGGLEDHVLKSATVSSTVTCPAFTDMYFEASPIVRVAVQPKHPGDMERLVEGMRMLNQADPCVEVLVQQTGEHVLIAAGEVHLQKCLDDLRQSYAKIDVSASEPIVPFRETIIMPPKVDMVNEIIQDQNQVIKFKKKEEIKEIEDDKQKKENGATDGYVELSTPNQKCTVCIKATPLPESVIKLLEDNSNLLKTVHKHFNVRVNEKTEQTVESKLTIETISLIKELKEKLEKAFEEDEDEWGDVVNYIWSFGPNRKGPNILVNKVPGYDRPSIWSELEKCNTSGTYLREFDNSVVSGFQMATLSGPLCEEPMMGVCFSVEKWDMVSSGETPVLENVDHETYSVRDSTVQDALDEKAEKDEETDTDAKASSIEPEDKDIDDRTAIGATKRVTYGPFSGQLMSTVKLCCRKAFQAQPQRLMVAMYSCVIQCTAEVLGKMYGVLGKRNGRILGEEMKEGSSLFNINAALPVIESFGFAEEIRKKTSGLASPQFKFSHWEVIDVDPFWVPTTEEEYLHFGDKADSDNNARKYKNNVRKRKGLKVDEKLVEFGTKQRTLTKNK